MSGSSGDGELSVWNEGLLKREEGRLGANQQGNDSQTQYSDSSEAMITQNSEASTMAPCISTCDPAIAPIPLPSHRPPGNKIYKVGPYIVRQPRKRVPKPTDIPTDKPPSNEAFVALMNRIFRRH